MKSENSLNVRRMVGAILLALGAIGGFSESQSVSGLAMFGLVRQYQTFLYFFSAWALGLAIWYFVTLKKPTNRKAEKIVKIIFYIVVGANVLFAFMSDMANAGVFGIVLIIIYTCAAPWGKLGYKKHPYSIQ